MKYSLIAVAAFFGCVIASCSGSKDAESNKVPVFDMAANISVEETPASEVKDFACTQLSGDEEDAFFRRANILDVVGDTVVLIENTPEVSRLIMFNLKDGQYLGQINHRGQGPGEYNIIAGAFVDSNDGIVLIPNFNSPAVYKYALATDSLVATIEREYVMTMMPPIGGITSCINVAVQSPDGLEIVQYNAGYQRIDSVSVPGFQGGNFNMVWGNAGVNGVAMFGDTLYALAPGVMHPLALLSLGDYALTNEKDQDITMKIMTSGESEIELLKPYIIVRDVQFTDGKMLLTSMHDGVKYSDLYDMADGKLIYRSVYSQLPKTSEIKVVTEEGETIEIGCLFAKDGKWYGIISESADAATADSNCSIVSFIL